MLLRIKDRSRTDSIEILLDLLLTDFAEPLLVAAVEHEIEDAQQDERKGRVTEERSRAPGVLSFLLLLAPIFLDFLSKRMDPTPAWFGFLSAKVSSS